MTAKATVTKATSKLNCPPPTHPEGRWPVGCCPHTMVGRIPEVEGAPVAGQPHDHLVLAHAEGEPRLDGPYDAGVRVVEVLKGSVLASEGVPRA